MANKVDLSHLQQIADAMASGTNNAVRYVTVKSTLWGLERQSGRDRPGVLDHGGPKFCLQKFFSDDEDENKDREQTMELRELMKNQNKMTIDEDFGDELKIPLPEDIMDWTFKGVQKENVYLQKYELGIHELCDSV